MNNVRRLPALRPYPYLTAITGAGIRPDVLAGGNGRRVYSYLDRRAKNAGGKRRRARAAKIYRAAMGAPANQLEELRRMKEQLNFLPPATSGRGVVGYTID